MALCFYLLLRSASGIEFRDDVRSAERGVSEFLGMVRVRVGSLHLRYFHFLLLSKHNSIPQLQPLQ